MKMSATSSLVRLPLLAFSLFILTVFLEQEITGDVLLELDVNVLKTEIGIPAFGKRMRIANAIAELRRPPSVSSFEPRPEAHTPSSIIHQPSIHQRSLSQTHSHHSFPGTPLYGQTHSTHSSMGSPMGYSLSSNAPLMPQPEVNETNGLPANAAAGQHAAVGLGIAVSESANGRGAVSSSPSINLWHCVSDVRLSGAAQVSSCCLRAPRR